MNRNQLREDTPGFWTEERLRYMASDRYRRSGQTGGEMLVSKAEIAKLFQNGRSRAVRLPREFRFSGDRARIRRGRGGSSSRASDSRSDGVL